VAALPLVSISVESRREGDVERGSVCAFLETRRPGIALRALAVGLISLLALFAVVLFAKSLDAATPARRPSSAAVLADLQIQIAVSADGLDKDSLQLSWRFRPVVSKGDSTIIGLRLGSRPREDLSGEGDLGRKGNKSSPVPTGATRLCDTDASCDSQP